MGRLGGRTPGRRGGGVLAILLAVAAAPSGGGEAVDGLGVFFGDLHAHTSYSDGELTPKDAYGYARLVGKLDFLGLSDHAYRLNERPEHLADLFEQARRATRPGVFVALPGGEWTHPSQGHVNVFAWEALPDRNRIPEYPDLYAWLSEHPVLFAQFNHPGLDIQQNWDLFRYDPRADPFLALLEVGSGPFPGNLRYEASYGMALDRGWHVGAAANSDVHRARWGTATPSRTAVWAAALDEESLVQAIRARRTYATEDPDARLVFRAGTAWMGARLPAPAVVRFDVELWDPDPQDRFDELELVGPRGEVVQRVELRGALRPRVELNVSVPWGRAYYYVRARQTDGDRLVSSPIWLEHPSLVWLADFRLRRLPAVRGKAAAVLATVVNGRSHATCVRVRWASVGAPGGAVAAVLRPLRATSLELPWIPAVAGRQQLLVELEPGGPRGATGGLCAGGGIPQAPPGFGRPNRYGLAVWVRPSPQAAGLREVDEVRTGLGR